MVGFLSAHGDNPGPTQRPLLGGAISGIIATLPAVAILLLFGALAVEARILGLSQLMTGAVGVPLMAAAGALYARIFGRAANNQRGSWLFGMAFGFALWAAGAVMVLPLASGGQAPAGKAAVGLFLSLVTWGATLGVVQPFVERPLHESIESGSRRESLGPSAAAAARHGQRPTPGGEEPPSQPRP